METFALAVALVVSVVGMVAAACYIPLRRNASRAYRKLLLGSKEDRAAARTEYWRLDRLHIKVGLTVIGCYLLQFLAVGIFNWVKVLERVNHPVLFWGCIGATAALIVVGVTAEIYNFQDSQTHIEHSVNSPE